jgi:CheY-like chemotaxis protein
VPYNILVIDDDKTTADATADLLRLLDHNVIVAYGPRAAMTQVAFTAVDIVFLDINMPGVSGIEVCRYLRRDPNLANLPIIVVSANDEKPYKEAAFNAGATGYIVKPAMLEDLEAALRHVKPPATPER